LSDVDAGGGALGRPRGIANEGNETVGGDAASKLFVDDE
jgi:hypothetical protein